MFDAYVISTQHAFPDNEKVRNLTSRCIASCRKHGIKSNVFDAITPYNVEEVYPGWDIEIEYAYRLKNNFERKAGKPITPEMMTRMLVMQQCMTMSHYMLRKQLQERGETAIILEHDAIVLRDIPLFDEFKSKVVNLCSFEQATHGYVTNPNCSRLYNKKYEEIGFVGHDNMSRHITGSLKITPYKGNPIVGGNALNESQWDTHRGALKEKNLSYMPTTTVGDVENLLERIEKMESN